MLTGEAPVGGKRKESGQREKLSCNANPDDSLSPLSFLFPSTGIPLNPGESLNN